MKKANASLLLAALLGGLMAQSDVLAEEQTVYKWVDDEGVAHFTARPPEDVDYVEVGVETGDAGESEAGQGESQPEQSDESEDVTPEQAQPEAPGPDPEVVAKRCQQARNNIEKLTQQNNLVVSGEDGQQRVLTSEQRQNMLEKTQAFLDEWC